MGSAMLGGIHTDLLISVTLLFVIQCRAGNNFSSVTLPNWETNSDYITVCFDNSHTNMICNWTRSQQTVDVTVIGLESGPLEIEGEACLEFWYLAPVAANGSELQALLKTTAGLAEIWTSPTLPRNSWTQVFVPLHIIEPETKVVLEAVSIEEQVTFKHIGVRRGSCGPQCESNTEFWTDEFTRCLCSAGQLSCSPAQCPRGQICPPQRGNSSGSSTSGTCTIQSHTDFSTFDGVLFRFISPCTFVLSKTCSPTETLPMFSVQVVNKHSRNSTLPTVQKVTVNIGNFRVSLLKRQTHRVVVNGIWKKLPLSLSNAAVNIKSNPAAVLLGTSFGLSVSYDNTGSVHVTLPSAYSDKVCGLCGNFNYLREDDFRKLDGTNAQDATALAESWQTGETTSPCETILVPQECDPMERVQYGNESYCGVLLSSTGPFADCHSVLEAESYFRSCMVSMCSTHDDQVVLCEILQAYADICQEAGVTLPIWRNSTFCSPQCGENSHYTNLCADGCPEVCSILDIPRSCASCEERCECDPGFKLSGRRCVPADDCGCWYNGKHYEKGARVMEGACVQQCQCMGNNNMWCTAIQCADNEVCKDKDGVKGCFAFKPATCSVYGDPHYITFDKLAYDFQGDCSYILTTTCGSESSAQFTVIGHNGHPLLQNFTRSKLEAVTLRVEDLYLTLNQNGDVYVNNSFAQLPYSISGTYGSVWISTNNNYIILKTSFGLRMMMDGQNRLFLQVDEHYKYQLCGLCGTYSGHQGDDFITPEGQNVTEAFEFGDSWRVPDNNECIAYPIDPRLCDHTEMNEANKQCYTLLGDAFSSCHQLIHPSIYFNSCVYDYCATEGDQHTLCESLKSYAAACQVAGVELPPWQTGTACADPPTTATLPTTPTPTTPTPDQTFCPINCDFEKNLCGWEQLIQDSFDWTRNSGPISSNLTGPNQDHTTGDGFYIYTDGSSASHGDSARLLSSVCHYNGPVCLNFWYNMYGSATAMALNIYMLKDNKATQIWSRKNNQGPEWYPGSVDIKVPGPFQIILEGIRGSNALSDVAIDDISIHFGTCSGQVPESGTEFPPTTVEVISRPGDSTVCSLGCNFDSNLCSWNQMITDAFDWTWQSGSTPTLMTGPSADHTGGGHYLYIEASSVTYGDTSRLISSECSDSGAHCLQFWYHMYGSADTMGLHVYLLQNGVANAVWRKRNDQGDVWHLAQVDITATGPFQIIFEGRRGSNDQSDVAIDDVSLQHGQCAGQVPGWDNGTELPPTDVQVLLLHPAPTCLKNSHYTTCIPACSPTCIHLNGPTRCSDDNGCVPGCVCDDGFVSKFGVCVPIQQCGCVDRNGNKHQFSEVWYTSHCSQKCKCERDNRIGKTECADKDECDGNAVCLQNDEGNYDCQSTGFSKCTIDGDPEYKTFDKMKHDFKGEHSYVLVRTDNLPNNLPDVYIESINTRTADDDNDDSHHYSDSSSEEDSKEHKEPHRLQELKIRVYNHTLEFKKNRSLVVNGRRANTPVSPTAGLKIWEHSSHIYLKTDFGLSVEFDGHSTAEITLPHVYKKKVGGLCGNFDGKKGNDRMKPDGTWAISVQEFGESWAV
uniref:Zonadhesin-like n=1 Tax=Monopterus albus TaxID=43700 RepID=A0A3Q3QVR9_MONAL|nr:zonadhesin-like isoform X2 [Monopterus albus]